MRTYSNEANLKPTLMALVTACSVLGMTVLSGAEVSATNDKAKDVRLKLILDLESKADLSSKDVKYHYYPEGRSFAYTYSGIGNPKEIAYYQKLGFRTTVYVRSSTSEKVIKALEDAGAEIGVAGRAMWGSKGTKGSSIGANTRHGAFHAAATTRIELSKKAKCPIAVVSAATFHAGRPFLYSRAGCEGYGFVFQDSNYLQNTCTSFVIVSRGDHSKTQILCPATAIGGSRAHELIVYQTLNNQFRGAMRRKEQGRVINFSMPSQLDAKQRKMFERIVGRWGKDERIWHARQGEIAGLAYLKKKSRIVDVKPVGSTGMEVLLSIDADVFPDYLLAPLPLQFPASLPIKEARIGGVTCAVTKKDTGIHVDVPIQKALRNGCAMTLATSAPDMEIPGEMTITLSMKNMMDKPMEDVRFHWVAEGHPGMTLSEAPSAPFSLAPNAEKKIVATVKTVRGAWFGLRAIEAVAEARVDGEDRVFMEGFEIQVKPRLRVEGTPRRRVPYIVGRRLPYLVDINNYKSHTKGGPPSKFISHRTGPCKGVVTFQLPEGMEADPPQQSFELPEHGKVRLLFWIKNNTWSPKLEKIIPLVTFDGEKTPIQTPFPGTQVVRDKEQLNYKPLDELGLTLHANWDDPDNWKHQAVNPRNYRGVSGVALHHEGKKGYCIKKGSMCFFDPFKTSNYEQGTVCLWIKRDPSVRNENQYRPDPKKTWKIQLREGYFRGEYIAGEEPSCGPGNCGMSLRRWPGWGGKEGYLEAVYRCIGNKRYYVQVPFENKKLWTWRHVTVLWHMNDRRLEIYVDGELKGKADPGDGPWLGLPWNMGRPAGGTNAGFGFGSNDHGKKTYMLRDEIYVYDKVLTPEQIKANMKKAEEGQ